MPLEFCPGKPAPVNAAHVLPLCRRCRRCPQDYAGRAAATMRPPAVHDGERWSCREWLPAEGSAP